MGQSYSTLAGSSTPPADWPQASAAPGPTAAPPAADSDTQRFSLSPSRRRRRRSSDELTAAARRKRHLSRLPTAAHNFARRIFSSFLPDDQGESAVASSSASTGVFDASGSPRSRASRASSSTRATSSDLLREYFTATSASQPEQRPRRRDARSSDSLHSRDRSRPPSPRPADRGNAIGLTRSGDSLYPSSGLLSAFDDSAPALQDTPSHRIATQEPADTGAAGGTSRFFPSLPQLIRRAATNIPGANLDAFDQHGPAAGTGAGTDAAPAAASSPRSAAESDESHAEGQAVMLSRLLAIAATMTASSLVGSARSSSGEAVGRDLNQEDTTFDGFIRNLRNGLLASELTSSANRAPDAGTASPAQSRNFFRMFRFSPSETDPTLIPILLLGIRSAEPAEHSAAGSERSANMQSTLNLFDRIRGMAASRNAAEQSAQGDPESDGLSDHGSDPNAPAVLQGDNMRDSIDVMRDHQGLDNNDDETQSPTGSSLDSSSEEGAPSSTSRQWIVYVVGGSYPENHPLLLAPTLFSDNPSYEDMLVLENFVGQVKSPTASSDDVKKAGGIHTVTEESDERCLVCLSEYKKGDVCRSLKACSHSFHKECIDQWLTTGRNSCPLCRGQGVKDTMSAAPAAETTEAP